MSLRNAWVVAKARAACVFVAYSLVVTGGPHGCISAAAQACAAEPKTAQYTETRTNQRPDGRRIQGMVRRVQILGAHHMCEELTHTPGDQPEPLDNETYVQIHDTDKGVSLTLYPDSKKYQYVTRILSITEDGNVGESKPERIPQNDYYGRVRNVPLETAVKLDDKFVNGKLAHGFEVVEKAERANGTDTWTRRYWIDPTTKLPVQVEVSFRSTKPGRGESDWVKSDFVFDQPLDEALFGTDPPAGYEDRNADSKKAGK